MMIHSWRACALAWCLLAFADGIACAADAPAPGSLAELSDKEVFSRFAAMAGTHCRNAPARSPLTMAESGLAQERRIRMRRLIAEDPARAIAFHEETMATLAGAGLPPVLTEGMERRIEGIGDLDVLAGDDFDEEGNPVRSFLERWATVDGVRYRVATYGRRALLGSKRGLAIYAIAMDDCLALADAPARTIPGPGASLVGHAGRTWRFPSPEDAAAFLRAAQAAEARPGPDVSYPDPVGFRAVPENTEEPLP